MKVFIIQYCQNEDSVYGNTLTTKTVRIGFPEAEIIVIDNGSKYPIENEFPTIRFPERKHSSIIRQLIMTAYEPTVILDPDIIFWDRSDNFEFDLISGRFIPKFVDEFSGCLTHSRLHTSFLMFDEKLKGTIHRIESIRFESDLISPYMYRLNDKWYRFDTLSSLCQIIRINKFSDDQLDKYDHLFCGTHLNSINEKVQIPELNKIHDLVKSERYTELKGVWKEQQKFFEEHHG